MAGSVLTLKALGAFIAAAVLAGMSTVVLAQGEVAPLPVGEDFRLGEAWEFEYCDAQPSCVPMALKVETAGAQVKFVDREPGLQWLYMQGDTTTSPQPWRVWPLALGQHWRFEGVTVLPQMFRTEILQDVVVAAFEEVVVPAGRFMAFRIEHRGHYTGTEGTMVANDTYWYAPSVKMDIKHNRTRGANTATIRLARYDSGH